MYFRFLYLAVSLSLLGCTSTTLAAVAEPGSERWQKKLDRYLARDRTNPPTIGGVVFTGSSSIEMWESLHADFPQHNVVNRGIGGTYLADVPAMAEKLVLPLEPKLLVVYAGENDLHAGRSVDDVVAAFKQVRAQLFAAQPDARLVFLALKPSPSRVKLMPQMREANTRIAKLCAADRRCTFVDVFTPMLDAKGAPRAELFIGDKLHMNAEGYRLWADLVRPALTKQ